MIRFLPLLISLFALFHTNELKANLLAKAAHYRSYNDFEKNPYLNDMMRNKIRPYILPYHHPARCVLDNIFHHRRAILNDHTLQEAGFIILHHKPRSFIRIASHPKLPGYLFKIYLDSELREKNYKPGWLWLVARCKGATQLKKVIKAKKSRFFQVPNKWLYPLPPDPSPPKSEEYKRQLVILIVEDMNLVSDEETVDAWKTQITHSHLKELYAIISKAKGSSYRPDNICLSKNGKFSFIDTEYPKQKADYGSIRPFLSPEMRHYWDKLVRQEGVVINKALF